MSQRNKLPDGVYPARAVEVEPGESKNGFPQVKLTYEVIGGPFEGDQIEQYVIFASAANARISFETLSTNGWDGADEAELAGVGDVEVEITVEGEEYGGKVRQKVKYVNRPGEGRPTGAKLDDSGKATFKAKLQALRREAGVPAPVARPAPAARQPAATQPAAATGTDDIPF